MENKFTLGQDTLDEIYGVNQEFKKTISKLKKQRLIDECLYLHLVLMVAMTLPAKAMKKEDFVQYAETVRMLLDPFDEEEIIH